jgi:hypothetical protein
MGGYKQTDPTCYIVDWPDAGVFKVGFSCNQRWRKFVLRGANVVALHSVPGATAAFALECYFENYALMLCRRAFDEKTDEARALLGSDAGGYLECHRGDGHKFYDLMLKHCSPSIAQIAGVASDASTTTDGRTNARTHADGFSPTADTSSSVTRTRTYGFSPLATQEKP